jgi:hypothetical protein
MIQTGFYTIALRKEAERRLQRIEEDKRRQERMNELKIKLSHANNNDE